VFLFPERSCTGDIAVRNASTPTADQKAAAAPRQRRVRNSDAIGHYGSRLYRPVATHYTGHHP